MLSCLPDRLGNNDSTYYVMDSAVGDLISQQPYVLSKSIIFLQSTKMKYREIEWLDQGQLANEWIVGEGIWT